MKASILRNFIMFLAVALGVTAISFPGRTESSAPSKTEPTAAGEMLEDLRYQVDVWVLKEAIDARMTFTRLDSQGRYRAEIKGRAHQARSRLAGLLNTLVQR